MNKKIFIFWIGSDSELKRIIEGISIKSKAKIVVGPSKTEHEYLMNNFEYYRKSFEQKIYAFCSDVWRCYKLANENGLYVDTSVEIGENIDSVFDDWQGKNVLVKEDNFKVATCMIFSDSEHKDIFLSALKIYKKFNNNYPRTFPISPYVLTFVSKGKNYELKPISVIRDKQRIFKVGSASWSVGYNASKYWAKMEKRQLKKSSKYSYYGKFYSEISDFECLFIPGIRQEYDVAATKKELMELKKMYKISSAKPRVRDLLIWSKFYRFFTFKWLKKK